MTRDIETLVRGAVRAESEAIVPPPTFEREVMATIRSKTPTAPRRGFAFKQVASAVGIIVLFAGGLLGVQLLRAHKGNNPPAAASETPGYASASPTSTPQPGWKTYHSGRWGYSIDYPADWYDVPNAGAPETEKYFSNENVGAPLQMTSTGVWETVEVQPYATGSCPPSYISNSVVRQSPTAVDGVETSRLVINMTPTGAEADYAIGVWIIHSGSCYSIQFHAQNAATRDAVAGAADQAIASFRFASAVAVPTSGPTPFNPGYTVPDAASGSGLGYDAVHGYPILFNQQHTGNADPGYPTFPTWSWTGDRWVQVLQGSSLHPTRGNLVYDPGVGMTVGIGDTGLFGWNGSTWVTVASIPGGVDPYLAFDQTRNVLVLLDAGASVPTTWTYDGRNWSKTNVGGFPKYHHSPGFAYDPETGTILAFGGAGVSMAFADTWEWNGATWTQLHPGKSPPAGPAVLGYDSATRQMILVASNGTTWQWNGSTWSQLPLASPPLGSYPGLVYDAVHQYLVLWEGNGGFEQGSQTWTYSASGWHRVS